ncbi:MAG: MFS transporter [Polyangiaceae bacterium]|nr:MFS transporter [Polyangiaceae bacterium]
MREPLLTRSFVVLSAAHFLYALSFYLYLHLPGLLVTFGASEIDIGVLSGVMSACAILSRPPVGRVMDVRGRRPILLFGGALGTVACAAYFAVDHWGPLLYGVRIAHGISEAMLFASLFALASDLIPSSRRIEGIGIFGVSGLLPMAIGGVLGDALISRGGYNLLFIAGTAANLIALVLSLPVPEPKRPEGEPPRGVIAAVLERKLVPLWTAGVFFAIALAAYFILLKTYVLSLGVGTIGDFFAAYAIVAASLRVFAGSLPERAGPKRVLGLAMALMTTGLILLAMASSRSHLVVAGALAGAGHGYTFPILLGLVVERARPTERGAALAVFTALFDAGTLLGGPLLGAIVEATSYEAMFVFAAAIVASGFVLLVVLDRRLLR